MMIIGCDFHPSWQQIAWLDTETGETGERKLVHADGDAERFYRQLAAPALIGMEATGGGGTQVGRTTLLDAAYPKAISRSRSHREQPEGGPGR